jgi:hypothetical protein
MSGLIKAQNTPQFSWYTCWTSLGANGTPNNLIEEGFKQPDCIKNFFQERTKEITGHVTPDQARFGAESSLAFTLPHFKWKMLTRISDTQKVDGPTLFNLMGQCFQDIGLTEWTNVIMKDAPTTQTVQRQTLTNALGITLRPLPGSPMLATS